jgi:hypothetical protein
MKNEITLTVDQKEVIRHALLNAQEYTYKYIQEIKGLLDDPLFSKVRKDLVSTLTETREKQKEYNRLWNQLFNGCD